MIEIFTACGQAAVIDFDEDEIKSCVELKNALTSMQISNQTEILLPSYKYQKRSKVATSGMTTIYFTASALVISFKTTAKLDKS